MVYRGQERGGLKDLLQERQIIGLMRDQYTLPNGAKLGPLPPLLYAGMLIEGGIVGYDSNVITGGIGAKYLGIGGDIKHQRDIVTVDLRAVNIANGQVMLSVTAEKTVYSTGFDGSIFKYVSFNKLLEAETGYTMNEPPQLAVRQAVDTRRIFDDYGRHAAGHVAVLLTSRQGRRPWRTI